MQNGTGTTNNIEQQEVVVHGSVRDRERNFVYSLYTKGTRDERAGWSHGWVWWPSLSGCGREGATDTHTLVLAYTTRKHAYTYCTHTHTNIWQTPSIKYTKYIQTQAYTSKTHKKSNTHTHALKVHAKSTHTHTDTGREPVRQVSGGVGPPQPCQQARSLPPSLTYLSPLLFHSSSIRSSTGILRQGQQHKWHNGINWVWNKEGIMIFRGKFCGARSPPSDAAALWDWPIRTPRPLLPMSPETPPYC